jgi:hypothetical protein
MSIVPLTTPLPVQLIGMFGFEVLAPVAWLFAGVAILMNGGRRPPNPPTDAA